MSKPCELVSNDYNICNCCDFNMNNLIGDIVTGCDLTDCDDDCDGAVVQQIIWTSKYMSYCPGCGSPLTKHEENQNER